MCKIFLGILILFIECIETAIPADGICSTYEHYYKNYYTEDENKKVCCTGYSLVSSSEYSSPLRGYYKCVPFCSSGCLNGQCQKPDVCVCPDDTIYTSTNSGFKICEFICNPPCVNGQCTKGHVCSCNTGYTSSENNECEPICVPKCVNAKCVSPNVCKCNVNYYLPSTKENICKPVCEKCTNGDCVEPNTCNCHKGYTWDIKEGDCKPLCKRECLNGVCLGNNKCSCTKGYKLDETNSVCIPICEPECVNSECLRPNFCKCHPNYTKHPVEHNKCLPDCQPRCINSECILVNVCSCFPGYQKNITHILHNAMKQANSYNDTIKNFYFNECHPVCDKCSNGNCTMPGKCECNEGYEWDYNLGDCTPKCDPPCENSICVHLNKCRCNEGFKHTIESHICEQYANCVDDCSLPPICKNNCDANSTESSQDQILECKHDGYYFDNITSMCKPVCKPSCVNSKCVAPDVCWCENVMMSYKPSLKDNSLCTLETCKKTIDLKPINSNKTCFKASVLELYDRDCPAIIANNSCFDALCVNDPYDICHKYYTCNITNESRIDELHCYWTLQASNETDAFEDENYMSTEVKENILHNYVTEKLCLPCLCPANETSELCLNGKINFRLCKCPNDLLHEFTSTDLTSLWNPFSLLTIILVLICILLLGSITYSILKNKVLKKNSDVYVVEAYVNNTYGMKEEGSSTDAEDHNNMYAEIK